MKDNKPNPRGKPMTNKQTSALLEAVKIILELSHSTDDSIQYVNRIQNQLKEKTAHGGTRERSEQTD